MSNPSPETPLTAEQEAEDREYMRRMEGSLLLAAQVAQRAWAEIDALRSRLAAVEQERASRYFAGTT